MRAAIGLIGILAILPLNISAQDNQPKKTEYKEFSRLVHAITVKQLPKEFVDDSGWGGTIPIEPNLPLPRLRTYVKVGDKLEMPHGTWRKFKGKIENPDKNLKIVIKDFKQRDPKTYRVVADVDATILVHAEVQHWQKGLLLLGADAAADANFTAAIVCDIGVSLNLKKFPPELNIEPKVTDLGLEFIDFKVRNGPILKGELGDQVRRDLKDVLKAIVKASEPMVKDLANAAIKESIKEGKGTISADAIMKALPK
jgi:hypothetical protein